MVKLLSQADRQTVEQAVASAEQATSVEIAVVVVRASDDYDAMALLYGFIFGSIAALVVWCYGMGLRLPYLLCLQFLVAALFVTLPWLKHLCAKSMPVHVIRHRVHQRAAEEFFHVAHHLPSSTAIALLHVSLAERRIQILTSRNVQGKIPESAWNEVVGIMTQAMRANGLRQALMEGIAQAAQKLAPHFPPGEARAHLRHSVMEIPN